MFDDWLHDYYKPTHNWLRKAIEFIPQLQRK